MRFVRAVFLSLLTLGGSAFADDAAFKIGGKTTTVGDLYKEDQASFFKIEEEKFQLIEQIAQQKYLENHWQNEAKKSGKSVDAVRKEFADKNSKVSAAEVKETLDKFKDHPQLKKLSKKEQESQINDYLKERKSREALDNIVKNALDKGELKVLYPRPKEPLYNVSITKDDFLRYGPSSDDIKPAGCSEDCPITVVEYSEFQCPFCSRVLPASKQLLTEFKGKVRWAVRDFPLSFHPRARPAAIAAHCAGEQGKFWHMYNALFENQTNLADADFKKYASKISGLDAKKWQKCFDKPDAVVKAIDRNLESGTKYGVSGTPAFFINGRRLSGALPYDEFKRVFDEEISSKRKS